jgi:hypothetical protein
MITNFRESEKLGSRERSWEVENLGVKCKLIVNEKL